MEMPQDSLEQLITGFYSKLSNLKLQSVIGTIFLTCFLAALVLAIISSIDKIYFYGRTFTGLEIIQHICFSIFSLSLLGLTIAVLEVLSIMVLVYLLKWSFNLVNHQERTGYHLFSNIAIMIFSLSIVLFVFCLIKIFGKHAFKVMILTLTYNLSLFASIVTAIVLLIFLYRKYKIPNNSKTRKFKYLTLLTLLFTSFLLLFITKEIIASSEILNYGFIFNKIAFLFENFLPGFYLLLLIIIMMTLFSLGYITILLPVGENKSHIMKHSIIEIVLLLVIFCILYFLSNNYLPNQLFIIFLPTLALLLFSFLTFLLLQIIIYKLYAIFKGRIFHFCPLKKSFISVLILYTIISLVGISAFLNNELIKAFNYRYCVYQKIFLCWSFLFNIKNKHHSFAIKTACIKDLSDKKTLNITSNKKFNIIIISIDALRADCAEELISKKGSTFNDFSQESLHFTNYYSNATYTLASISSMFTSRLFVSLADTKYSTIAQLLSELGYNTVKFTSLDPEKYDYIIQNAVLKPSLLLKGFKQSIITPEIRNSNTLDLRQIQRATKFIDNYNSDQPFFLWLHLQELHEKRISIIMQSPESVKRRYKSTLRNQDAYLRRFFEVLKTKKFYNKALIIITSDHGEAFKEHGDYYHLFTLYQEMIRIPLLIKLPDQSTSKLIDIPLSHINLLPGIMEYLGIPLDKLNLDGYSFINVLNNNKQDFKGILTSLYLYKTKDNFSYNIYGEDNYYKKRLMEVSKIDKNGEWKLIYNDYFGFKELYNLKNDPKEKRNLINKFPKKASTLFEDIKNIKNSL